MKSLVCLMLSELLKQAAGVVGTFIDCCYSRMHRATARAVNSQNLSNKIINQLKINVMENKIGLNIIIGCLVWCPGQNKRIAPLSFLHGFRKR
jgi:hypothetical protein